MNSKLNNSILENVISEIQGMDPELLMTIISPIIITIGAIKTKKYANRVFTLTKLKSTHNVKIKPNKNLFVNHGYNTNLDNDLKEVVNLFIKALLNNKNADLTFFYNNIKSLKVGKLKPQKRFLFIFEKDKIINVGNYDANNNVIRILSNRKTTINQIINTFLHELFHLASSNANERHLFSGFYQKHAGKKAIGIGLTEGYTSLLGNRYFQNEEESAYEIEARMAVAIEIIAGKDLMESLYFKADLYNLVKILKRYDSKNNVLKFLTNLDLVSLKKDRINKLLERYYVKRSLTKTCVFLIRNYVMLLKEQMDNNLISDDDFTILLRDFISVLGTNYTLGKTEINYLNEKIINECITKALGSTFNIFNRKTR